MNRITNFIRAIWETAIHGLVEKGEYWRRMRICDECPKLKRKEKKKYCGICGCGEWPLAELYTKNKMRWRCPLQKFGEFGTQTPNQIYAKEAMARNLENHKKLGATVEIRDTMTPEEHRRVFGTRRQQIELIKKSGGRLRQGANHNGA